jgi:hypothetical protein
MADKFAAGNFPATFDEWVNSNVGVDADTVTTLKNCTRVPVNRPSDVLTVYLLAHGDEEFFIESFRRRVKGVKVGDVYRMMDAWCTQRGIATFDKQSAPSTAAAVPCTNNASAPATGSNDVADTNNAPASLE